MRLYSLGILTVIAILVDSNGVANRRHNNCVTWRDDLLTLTITCRVANLSQPVTISDENGGIQINCSTIKQTPTCFPSEKNTSLDLNSRTVSIELIELKTARPLNRIWQCKQGETTLSTKVSFSRGIISDSWVNVRGNITDYSEGNRYIVVDCSSCRIPDANYVEFLINNRSHGSMNYNKSIGVCYYNFMKCNSFQCNCSSTGNMFQLRLLLTDDIEEIACEMHFYDGYRRGKVRITSNMQITGNVVLYDPSISEVIVKNEFPSTVETKYKTVTEDKIFENNKTMTSVSSDKGISTSLTVVCVIIPLVIVITVIVVLWHKRKLRQKNLTLRPPDDGKTTVNDSQSEGVKDEETNLLVNGNHSGGKSCKNTGKAQCKKCERGHQTSIFAEWFCFNCNEMICSACKLTHANFEQLQEHIVLPSNELPSTFSTSLVCQIHNKNEFTFYCTFHKDLLCVDCLNDCHLACPHMNLNVTRSQIERSQLQHDLHELSITLERKRNDIHHYQELLSTDVENVNIEISRLRDFPNADQKSTLSEIKQALNNQLELEQMKHKKRYESQRTEIQRLFGLVEREVKNLKFITNYANDKLLCVYIHQAKKTIDLFTSLIEETSKDLIHTELNFRWTLVDKCLGKIEFQSSKMSTLENTDSTVASQSPSVSIPVYSYHEKKFQLCFSNLEYVFDGSLVLVSKEDSKIVVYNPKPYKQNIVDIKYQPHCIAMIPNTKRSIVTYKTVDNILELDLENGKKLRNIAVKDSARAVLATTPCFILLGLRSKRIISVLQHDGQRVLNIETNNNIDQLCYYDNRITYISSNSHAIISIDVTGKEVSLQDGIPRPVDILTTNRGHFFVLEESEQALRKFSMDWRELVLDFEDKIIWKDVTAFCSNADASKIYILSRNGTGTVLSVLANVKEESSKEKLKGTLNIDENERKDWSRDSAYQT